MRNISPQTLEYGTRNMQENMQKVYEILEWEARKLDTVMLVIAEVYQSGR